jgi:hypothetical protein
MTIYRNMEKDKHQLAIVGDAVPDFGGGLQAKHFEKEL